MSTKTPSSGRKSAGGARERKSIGDRKKKNTEEQHDDAPEGTSVSPLVTIVGNMKLRSGTKLSTKKYSYELSNSEEEMNEDRQTPRAATVVARPWPASSPVAKEAAVLEPRNRPTEQRRSTNNQVEIYKMVLFSILCLVAAILLMRWIVIPVNMPISERSSSIVDPNFNREQVITAVLRQQDNAIQHWRSQQNLMWPVVLDLENKISVLSKKFGYDHDVVSLASLHTGELALDCRGDGCTDIELEKALDHLLKQSNVLAEHLSTTKIQIQLETVPIDTEMASFQPVLSMEAPSLTYCDAVFHNDEGESVVDKEAPRYTLQDELLCWDKHIQRSVHQLLKSHAAMKTQFAAKQAAQFVRLGESPSQAHADESVDGMDVDTSLFVDKTAVDFRSLLAANLKQLQGSVPSPAFNRFSARTVSDGHVISSRLDSSGVEPLSQHPEPADVVEKRSKLTMAVDSVAQMLFNEYWVSNSNMTTLMSSASQAKSIMVDSRLDDSSKLQAIEDDKKVPETFLDEVDVTNYVKEMIQDRKNKLIQEVHANFPELPPPVKTNSGTRPSDVFEYSSIMRGGRVHVTPLSRLIMTGAAEVVQKAVSIVSDRDLSGVNEGRGQRESGLTVLPFAITGSRQSTSGGSDIATATAFGSPSWARTVLQAALGWSSFQLGADPQVIISHLLPYESIDGRNSDVVAPGSCYAFAGDSGNITIDFKVPIVVYSIAIYHPSPSMLPPPVPAEEGDAYLGGISSAPRDFTVYGWEAGRGGIECADEQCNPLTIGEFSYTASSDESFDSLQEFVFNYQDSKDIPMRSLTISFRNNHGNPLFTCVYRIKVYGRTYPQQQ